MIFTTTQDKGIRVASGSICPDSRQGLAEKRQRFSTLALRHNQSDVIVLLVGAEAPDLIDNGLDGDLRRHIAVALQGRPAPTAGKRH